MSQKSCPKCAYACALEAAECPKCGIVFGKFIDSSSSPETQVMGNASLVEMWKNILQKYEDKDLHNAFIQKSLQYKKLNFASQQYRKMLEVNPLDEIAKEMQDKIVKVASFQMMSQKPNRKFEKAPKWNSACIGIGSLMFFVGFLVGKPLILLAGIVTVVLMFALRFKRNTTV